MADESMQKTFDQYFEDIRPHLLNTIAGDPPPSPEDTLTGRPADLVDMLSSLLQTMGMEGRGAARTANRFRTLMDMAPLTGDMVDARDVVTGLIEGNPSQVGLGALGAIPVFGGVIKKAIKFRSLAEIEEAAKPLTNLATNARDTGRVIEELYIGNSGFDVDMTYGTGQIHRSLGLPEPTTKLDINPKAYDVIKSDVRQASPVPNNSVNSVILDLPFVVRKAKDKPGIMEGVFSKFNTVDDLIDTTVAGVRSAAKMLKSTGHLVVKVQDIVPSTGARVAGRRVRVFPGDEATIAAKEAGLVKVDEIITPNVAVGLTPKGAEAGAQRSTRSGYTKYIIFEKL